MPSVTALRRWLVFVALLRLLSVYLGFFAPHRLGSNLYTESPEEVSDLAARVFATWTLTSCLLCLVCARDPTNAGVYGATLASFLVALGHFALELLVFRSLTLRTAAQPLAVAATSSLWMAAGWNYYTAYAARAEPTASEETTVQPEKKDG